jgi:hypothetical protein
LTGGDDAERGGDLRAAGDRGPHSASNTTYSRPKPNVVDPRRAGANPPDLERFSIVRSVRLEADLEKSG